jgi:hypothetical protein
LQKASVVVHENTLLEAVGLVLQKQEPVCHFSTGVEVVSFSSKRCRSSRTNQLKRTSLISSKVSLGSFHAYERKIDFEDLPRGA